MAGRVNAIANTVTETTTSVVDKTGNVLVNFLTILDDLCATGAIYTTGMKRDAYSLEEIKGDERAFSRVVRADALAEQIAAHKATKAKQS